MTNENDGPPPSADAGALAALREVAAAAQALDAYEDFSVAGYCKACRPAHPEEWTAARGRLHLALASLERDEAAPPSSGAAELRAVWAGIVKAAAGCPVPTGVCQDRCGPERCELDAAITAALAIAPLASPAPQAAGATDDCVCAAQGVPGRHLYGCLEHQIEQANLREHFLRTHIAALEAPRTYTTSSDSTIEAQE